MSFKKTIMNSDEAPLLANKSPDEEDDEIPDLSSSQRAPSGCMYWRKHWVYATVMLCCYGFFKEFKPSEPFLNPYLVSPDYKNFSQDEVRLIIYTASSYIKGIYVCMCCGHVV